MISRKFVKCFKQLHFKEHFRTAASEIIGKPPFLKINAGWSSNTLSGRDPADQIFPKMLQNFPEHLIYLSTEAPLGNNS